MTAPTTADLLSRADGPRTPPSCWCGHPPGSPACTAADAAATGKGYQLPATSTDRNNRNNRNNPNGDRR